MAVKKQPDGDSGTLAEGANNWFRQFLKHLEMFMTETGHGLPSDANHAELSLAAMRAVKLTLLESGLDDEQMLGLLGRVALEHANGATEPDWTAELNQRRFELIDGDIQACRESCHKVVMVLGHPDFYPRFGFLAELSRPLESPFGGGEAWMALELVPGALEGVEGRVEFSQPFSAFE